jgi:hypothetical protein
MPSDANDRLGSFLSRQARRHRPEPEPWTPAPAIIGRDDHRPFAGVDDLDPLFRLARYVPGSREPLEAGEPQEPAEPVRTAAAERWIDPVRQLLGQRGQTPGGPFQEVRPGSLADVARIHVFVHGWLPGGREHAQQVYAVQGQVVRAWDEGVTNRYGNSPVRSYAPLLEAFAEREPDAAVLWYSWVDQSGTDDSLFAARGSLQHTAINGRRLAAALAAATRRPDGEAGEVPRIHLVGHSHGCVVATTAALALRTAPVQLTLLDCPEDWFSRAGGAAGLLTGVLPRLHPGRGAGSTFVDAYASMFGTAYHDDPGCSEVVDVRVAPVVNTSLPESAASQAHQYAVRWYQQSVTDPQVPGGYQWSPMTGNDTTGLGSGYLARGARVVEVFRHKPKDAADPYLVSSLGVEPQRLTGRAPDVSLIVTLPPDATLVEFDLRFERPGRAARVDAAVDGSLVFTSHAASPVPRTGRYLRVKPGLNTLQFRLADAGLLGSATVSGLRVVRSPDALQNLDDRGAFVQVATIGAAVGAAGTLAAIGAGLGLKRLVSRLLS